MKQKENVLSFPTNRIVREVPSERKKELMDKKFQEEIGEVARNINDEVLEMLLSVTPENYDKKRFSIDASFATAILSATVARLHGLKHPLHKFIDDHIKAIPAEEMINESELKSNAETENEEEQ